MASAFEIYEDGVLRKVLAVSLVEDGAQSQQHTQGGGSPPVIALKDLSQVR